MAEPIVLNNEDDLVDFLRVLLHAGWAGRFTVARNGEDVGYRLDMTNDDETVALYLGGDPAKGSVSLPAIAVAMGDGGKYLQYTASDYDELRAVLNP